MMRFAVVSVAVLLAVAAAPHAGRAMRRLKRWAGTWTLP